MHHGFSEAKTVSFQLAMFNRQNDVALQWSSPSENATLDLLGCTNLIKVKRGEENIKT